MEKLTVVWIVLGIVFVIILLSTIKTVPQRRAYVVERLGKYRTTLHAGLHILFPFIDKIRYRHTLKEQAIDVASQTCITKDNIAVEVDGVLYLQVMDAAKASYGIDNYKFASIQIAQTTMRSIIGRMVLDKTFEERDVINTNIVEAVDKASDPWGVKVARYEVKNITPPQSIKDAMEKQMRAEREKRAMIAESEGEKQARINVADGEKQEMIKKSEGARIDLVNKSEGEMTKRINEAEGTAQQIERVANATAKGIREIAGAIGEKNGLDAVNLRIAEQYLQEFGKLASTNNSLIIPSNLSDVSSIIASATKVFDSTKEKSKPVAK